MIDFRLMESRGVLSPHEVEMLREVMTVSEKGTFSFDRSKLDWAGRLALAKMQRHMTTEARKWTQ